MAEEKLQSIDAALRRVNREVWIITAAAGGRRGGLVATWVSQASLDPQRPVLVVAVARNHYTAELIDAGGALAAQLIGADQLSLAWNFAIGSGRDRDKLAEIPHRTGETGAPILRDALAWVEGRVFARLEGGDRLFFWADLVAGESNAVGDPLREHQLFAVANDPQRQALRANLAADIEVQQPLLDAWRDPLPEYLRPRHQS